MWCDWPVVQWFKKYDWPFLLGGQKDDDEPSTPIRLQRREK